jgi:hypothetical protein
VPGEEDVTVGARAQLGELGQRLTVTDPHADGLVAGSIQPRPGKQGGDGMGDPRDGRELL